MSVVALGEMASMGLSLRELDAMPLADLASWHGVLGAYHDALDSVMKRELG